MNETTVASDGSASTTEVLYVVGTTWGFMDDGAHALNGYGHFGGRDVVLLKLVRDTGAKVWSRQFGTTANDFGYGVVVDAPFQSLLLSGGCVAPEQIDTVIEVDVADVLEARAPFTAYEAQMTDPRTRSNVRSHEYAFAASYSFSGDLLDFTMDGGVTLTPRRQRIDESSVLGEYAVVLNRKPLNNVTVCAEVVQFADPSDSAARVQQLRLPRNASVYNLTFTPSDWNREQYVTVAAVDDAIAEGVHYARITHTTVSRDPSFHGAATPFVYGRNVTVQVEDNDFAGIALSRAHVFVGEGGMTDAYDVVLTSQPWHTVTVVVLPLHGNQTSVATPRLTFSPATWNVPQTIVVHAVDDAVSENEFGGLHYGGALLHYSESKDFRYHTRRPQCFDVVNCAGADCIQAAATGATPAATTVRVCDLTTECAFTLGNGACIASVEAASTSAIPARFGSPVLDPRLRDAGSSGDAPALSITDVRATLTAQATDQNASRARNSSTTEALFVPPPVELRGFVLSFLGLLNLEQAQKLALSPRRVLYTVCTGLSRLETHRWAFDEWPSGYVARVLETVQAMFPGTLGDERRMWNCGVSLFRGAAGGSAINVTIWDNDPGVTLSNSELSVREASANATDTDAAATYSIVLNAPPSATGTSLRPAISMCTQLTSDACGLWSSDFKTLAMRMYPQSAANVSIAIVSNAQLTITPALVTFTTTNWFIPQWITVRAVDDSVAEADASYEIAHRVQQSPFGYTNATAFWFAGTFASAPAGLFRSQVAAGATLADVVDGAEGIPYNTVPTVLQAPAHEHINVRVVDNDHAGVQVVVDQPEQRVLTKESPDTVDYVGDFVTSYAFSDVSLASGAGTTTGSALASVLVLGPNATSFLKFHVPHTHEGDARLAYKFATLRLFETPYKVFNVSDATEAAAAASSSESDDSGAFTKVYRVRITLVQNAWTTESVRSAPAANASALPPPLAFAAPASIDVTATVEKRRAVELDVTPLLAQVLPTRAALLSLRIDVLSGVANATQTATQLCSSRFERKLRPSLQLGYAFPNLLRLSAATQSSTTASVTDPTLQRSAALAVDGDRRNNATSATESSSNAWWQTCLSETKRVGQVAVFVPESMVGAELIAITYLEPLDRVPSSLDDALAVGCPSQCPRSSRLSVRGNGVLLWDLDAGLRCLRIYRDGTGALELTEVEAYDSFVHVTPSTNGASLRSRLKTDWTAQRASESWRIQQSALLSEEENLALGMATRQISTTNESAFASLAVDGQVAADWDVSVVQRNASEAVHPGSTRTQVELNPWWEVDLGAIKPISAVVLFPFVGMAGRGFCAPVGGASSTSTSSSSGAGAFPSWAGDLYSYSKTDPLLQLEDPFRQDFEVLITDVSLATAADPLAVAVTRKTTLAFSCANATRSIAWSDAFTRGRFVTVRKQGRGVLMLNEVQVLRWNPSVTPRYVLLDLYSAGSQPLALSSVQLFPPTAVTASAGGYGVPIPYTIHSASSQAAATGAGSALALTSVTNGLCYTAAKATAHEWIILDLGKPTRVGLIELDASVAKCSANVASVHAVSIGAHGAALDGIRSTSASNALTAAPGTCEVDATGALASGTTLVTCAAIKCAAAACSAHVRAVGAASTLVLSDFSDVVALGMVDFVPMARLPLSMNEHRALVLRDNPVMLWAFDELATVTIHTGDVRQRRSASAFVLATATATKTLVVDTAKEETFSSSAVVLQPAMPAFSLEFWLQFTQDPDVSASRAVSLVTLAGNSVVFASIELSSDHPLGVFTLTDPDSRERCVVALDGTAPTSVVDLWLHVVATYDPAAAALALWLSYTRIDSDTMTQHSVKATCALAMFNVAPKTLTFGAATASAGATTGPSASGFVGRIASVAWYARALSRSEVLDHYHDFLTGTVDATTTSHNSYALRLASKPLAPVHIRVRADGECYRFNLCNVSVVPSALEIRPEDWDVLRPIHVVATSDQLYESDHTTTVTHEATSAPSYQLVSSVVTLDLSSVSNDTNQSVLRTFEALVSAFYCDLLITRVLVDAPVLSERQIALRSLQSDWSTQRTTSAVIVNEPYSSALAIAPLTVDIIDATVPGIEFSTSSLAVSEDGKGNDYQVLLLSEPTDIVEVLISVEDDCYRPCVVPAKRLCPSQTLANASSGAQALACGDVSTPSKLCNVTIAPSVLVFSSANWSRPQTVRVVAVDDELDERDVHLTTIKSASRSRDPIYDDLVLPDIVVAIEDNDVTDVVYSTKYVQLHEKPSLAVNVSTRGYYLLSLASEPWANVTIAMSNEANKSCYRPCGYHFDAPTCGLPRQQSVTSVRLSTNSTREIHTIALALPRVIEVQRVVTYTDHIDQVMRLDVTGGYREDVHIVAFAFSDAFKLRYKSADAIAAAVTYGRTFQLGASDRAATTTASLDGFASAASVQSALDGLFKGTDTVKVTRAVLYDQAQLQWRITFARLLYANASFPTLSVALDAVFEGTVTATRLNASAAPTGRFRLRYGDAPVLDVPVGTTALNLEGMLRDLDSVYTVAVTRVLHATSYGFTYWITFKSVETYETLVANSSGVVAAPNTTAANAVAVVATEMQAPVRITGAFTLAYVSAFNSSNNVTRTAPLLWNASDALVAAELSRINGIGNVSVSRRRLTAEGGMEWTVEFAGNNGQMAPLVATSVNLTTTGGRTVTLAVETVRDGESLGGTFTVEMGGQFKKMNAATQRVYWMDMPRRNTTALAFNATATDVRRALYQLNITERTAVTRTDNDCDAFGVCNGYTWTISYVNSPGDVPPIRVFGNNTLTGAGVALASATVANGTYIGGYFSLQLALFDIETKTQHTASTWLMPVNVSAVGMDEALEAIPFVRSNREAEFDPETRVGRGLLFDKGVRVYREGPYLDGGHTWRLEWAIEDYVRFQDLAITIDASLVTQEIEPLRVPTEFDLNGAPRCRVIPTARFALDKTDPFQLRGACVYDITNVTIQERFLCNYTVENPWIVFTPENWCVPQRVELSAVDDFLDEQTIARGNVTASFVSHTVFGDDLIYTKLALDRVVVDVESDDVARVLVSEQVLEVSEDGAQDAKYTLTLQTEPLYSVKIVVLPWLGADQTGCYRFGLCNLTLPTSEFVFTPRDWDVPQTVVVKATDDDLDEDDRHATGISHIAYSDDAKYHKIRIPTINVTVIDNDVSALRVLKTAVRVTEGGAFDTYDVVLATEPFAKVTVQITNVGGVGHLAVPTPNALLFTWKNWNVSQTVRVDALDDFTEDPKDSSSVLVHAIASNDVIYAKLPNLASVRVAIADNDVSGLALSSTLVHASESNVTVFSYSVRLETEPWQPVVVRPNANHGCYVRALSSETLCNVTILTPALYFGAGNWSVWQNVSIRAVDDWLVEARVHDARITHASVSRDPLYSVTDYASRNGSVTVRIADNDVAYVNISLQVADVTPRTQLHVAEGGFNDSYRIVLNSEPYDDVLVTIRPQVETIVDQNDRSVVRAAQVGVASGTSASLASVMSNGSRSRDLELVFTALDWFRPRVISVFAVDDKIAEDATQLSAIAHDVLSADLSYNVSNSSLGVVSVRVMVNDKEAIAPPVPLTATFDTTGTKILVAFDSTVFHGETMAVRPTSGSTSSTNDTSSAAVVRASSASTSLYAIKLKQFVCSLVFHLDAATYSLGAAAQCLWLDLKTLRIDLGARATISVNDTLVLNECAVFANQMCQSSNVVRARHTSRAYTQASVLVRVPSDIVTPRVVVMVPEDVSSCGAWSADATLSQGAGGRPFAQLSWFALPKTFVAALASVDAVATRTKTLYASLAPLCLKYAADWTSGKSSVMFVPKAELSAVPELAAVVSTMDTLRSACYLRSLAQTATTAMALKLQVDSTLLEPGVTYIVGLELTNAFGQRGGVAKDVVVRNLPGPSVFVVGERSLEVSRIGDAIALQVDATVSCVEQIGTQVGYLWSVASAPLGSTVFTAVNLTKANVAKDPRVFRLARTALDAETSYRFRVDAYMLNNSRASNSSTVIHVNVTRSALAAAVVGGARAIGERDALVLNGSSSTDPDMSTSPFVYRWNCVDVTNTTLSQPQECVNATASTADRAVTLDLSRTTGAVLALAPFSLQQNRTLVFTMNVSKTSATSQVTRTSTATTTVWTLQGSVPDVVIATPATKVTAASRVVLMAQVKSTYPYASRWVQIQGDLDLPDAYDANDPTASDAFALPLTSVNNVILRNKLTPGLTYVFRLVATDVNGNQGFGEVRVRVNSPPSSGRLSVTPTTGFAVQDTFTLACAEWTDDADDLPLKYAFSAIATAEFDALVANVSNTSALSAALRNRAKPLVADQLLPTAAVTMLPPTGMRAAENMTIVAFISDALGGVAFATAAITVSLPPEAKTDPLAFVNNLIKLDTDARSKLLLSAASILDGAYKSKETKASCADFGAKPLAVLCSGHGTCNTATGVCVCASAYIGTDCEFEVAAVRSLNTAILTNLQEASRVVEATTSELSQQALIMDTVVQASPAAFDNDGLAQVTALSSSIVASAFDVPDQSAFLDSAGATVLNALSTVMLLSSDSASAAASNGASGNAQRRLASISTLATTALDCSNDPPESAQTKTVLDTTIRTLHSLSALASQDALPEEDAVVIATAQIRALAAAGTHFTALRASDSSASAKLSVQLTDPAIACLESDLYLSAFVLKTPPHSLCSLRGATAISSSTVFAVHSRAALQAAQSGASSSVRVQSLSSKSLCVIQAAQKFRTTEVVEDEAALSAAAAPLTSAAPSRRLATTWNASGTGDSSSSEKWQPLVALSIPHTRPLSALEQRNFTTACHVWDAELSVWDADICFKDESASTPSATVCYCSKVGKLEVLVTLAERLDYYALYKDLYRNEPTSIVPAVTAAALLGLVVLGSKFGQRQDAVDAKRHKEKTIKGLNRAKWGELQQRTMEEPAVLTEDFATFCARTKKTKALAGESSRIGEQSRTAATSDIVTAASTLLPGDPDRGDSDEVRAANAVTLTTEIDAAIVLPNEARTLFGANASVDAQYSWMLAGFRVCNALLVILGTVLAFVGVDFHWVLGHSTSELLLYVYGKTLGLVLLVCGGILVSAGAVGFVLARRDATHISRQTYTRLLSLLLVAQLVLVAIACHFVDNLATMPSALVATLAREWHALDADVVDEIESYYGCCGFASITDRAACPEEALDAVPPRTCAVVLSQQAQTFFSHSFAYVQVLMLVEAACVLFATVLVKWRHLRLLQLAGAPASSVNGETSATRAMLQSQANVVLLCALPSLYYLFACVAACTLAVGVDLVAQLDYLSNALVSALYGIEVGALVIAASVVYLLVLVRGIHALAVRDVRGLAWFVGLALACLLASLGIWQFFLGLEANLRIDPAIMATTERRYLALPRTVRVGLELAMQCCGFDATTEGTCVVASSSSAAPPIRTCRASIETILSSSLALFNTRVLALGIAQAVVLALSVALLVRLRRFHSASSSILPASSAVAPVREVDEFTTSFDVVVRSVCAFVLVLLSLVASVFGLIVLWAGIDAIYELNVLHVSYLLQTVDRRIGVYLVALGATLVVFASVGVATAWTRSRRVFAVYAMIGLALFTVSFGVMGVSYRFASTAATPASSSTLSDTMSFRLQELWRAAPSPTKAFVQNALTCCGYDRVVLANGTVVFTDMAEATFWTHASESTTANVYARSLTAATPSSESRRITTRTLTATQTRTFTQAVCPLEADTSCSTVMAKYVTHVAQYAFKLSIIVLSFLVAVLLSASVLVVRQGKKTPWRQPWAMALARTGVFVLAFGSVFASLTTLFIALDFVVARWSLFSASLLELLFAHSLGVALLVYALLGLGVNVYSLYAATHNVVHQLFFQTLGRGVFALSLWVAAGFTGYLSHYAATDDWTQRLGVYLDRRWNTLSPHQQHVIALDYACCGFHDPVVVKGKGVVFDRPALGFTCPLSSARGCEHVLVTQISSSFAWLFVYVVCLAVAETVLLGLGAVLLQQLQRIKVEEWFAIESRIRYAVGKYRSEARKRHLTLSLVHTFDAKVTRGQRLCSLLCALLTTLAIFTGYFATQGCHRTSLKTCEQPDAWSVLGMSLLYGGVAGYAAQCVSRFLFELVRHRCDDETSEVATARQRKEKVLLFRSLFQRRQTPMPSASPTASHLHESSSSAAPSTINTSHATTEERWSTWLNRFVYRLYHVVAAALFVFACGVATLMGLVLVGYSNTLYGVKIDQGPKELLILSLLVAATSLLAWLAVDMKDRKRSGSLVVFVAVAIATMLLMVGALLGVYMVYQVLMDPLETEQATDNWTVRKTGFSVVQRLESAWKAETSTYFRHRVQQELQCCGLRSASDHALRPCPTGTAVQVEYEAQSVNGSAVLKAQTEVRDLDGCLDKMLAPFQRIADTIAYAAIGLCSAQFLLFASAIFLAYDVHVSKDAKLKLRVLEPRKTDVRQTFEKVVGLKIAAPARGKILSKMLSTSLDSVAPTIASELAATSLVPGSAPGSTGSRVAGVALPAVSSASTLASPHAPKDAMLALRRPSLSARRLRTSLDHYDDASSYEAIASVPYPASIVYAVFALCGAWIAAMVYLIVESSLALGRTTTWTCILCWGLGTVFHLLLIEPSVIFGRIVWSTLGAWWHQTWLVRLVRYGREALRIKPDAATAAARYYASLSLYERIRFNAAVRIQRRLLTRVTRRRYLQLIRERRQAAHRSLAEQRRLTVKRAIEGFTDDEVQAFRIIFQDADAAKIGLVSHTVISQSIYELGVRVPSDRVFQFLHDLDPAYADLVDLDHFLYGMHCARMYHQQEQTAVAADAVAKALAAAASASGTLKEEFVSSSARFGPSADPQSKVLVKRQNLLRELKEKRESLSYKLMSKVGKLPPLLQRTKGANGSAKSGTENSRDASSGFDDLALADQRSSAAVAPVRDSGEAPPTGAFVILQNRKLTPKKRALEMVLKKKHREDQSKGAAGAETNARSGASTSPTKSPSKTQRAKAMVQNWKMPSPRGWSATASPRHETDTMAIATVVEEDELVSQDAADVLPAPLQPHAVASRIDSRGDHESTSDDLAAADGHAMDTEPEHQDSLAEPSPSRDVEQQHSSEDASALLRSDAVSASADLSTESSTTGADATAASDRKLDESDESSADAMAIVDTTSTAAPLATEDSATESVRDALPDVEPALERTSGADGAEREQTPKEDANADSHDEEAAMLPVVEPPLVTETTLSEAASASSDDKSAQSAEPKSAGITMLRSKQASSVGKDKVLANILQKRVQSDDGDTTQEMTVSNADTANDSARAALKTPKARAPAAKSSLAKALQKKGKDSKK